jgi:hypothetical protein
LMSRAFVEDADYLEELPERPVSEHPKMSLNPAWRAPFGLTPRNQNPKRR